MQSQTEHWQDDPEEHDFPAASDYLSLLFSEADAAALVERLRSATTTTRKAKDLLRASRRHRREALAGARRPCARRCALDEDAEIPCRLVELSP